jgi:hypothetical protein
VILAIQRAWLRLRILRLRHRAASVDFDVQCLREELQTIPATIDAWQRHGLQLKSEEQRLQGQLALLDLAPRLS